MNGWAALVPWKQGDDSKSRLGGVLAPAKRMALASSMAAEVVARLSEVDAIRSLYLLAPGAIPEWPSQWLRDEGRGLNKELNAARDQLGKVPFVVIHADLPCLTKQDVESLLAAAGSNGAAFAPDRHGCGTNAVAIADGRPFHFAFGPDSFVAHRQQRPDAAIIECAGLGFDVDTPADLDQLNGFPSIMPSI